ncbi:hypothetical protein [Xanthobacter autotrophicus]|uniref:hypothetical protein n=1 Tax=Xanthobacter autotrophicus TaxID=280 RepID=UPI0024A6705B|nr:hypothetical protein [Xanthobacter autotrophicus]MDI4656022.1 helix-turn-helix domain-containing protein [Xanthobacter autotrophicus]
MAPRLAPHVMNALRLRKEVAALVRSRVENGKELPPPAGLAHVLARLGVVLDRDGPTVPGVRRAARALGAGDLPAAMVLQETRRAAAEGRLGHEWRLPAADALGVLLNVSETERAGLGLKLVGSRDLPAGDRRRAAERARKARTRAEAGATPRHAALSSTKPWEAAGVSRATYFRKQKMNETNSSASPSIIYRRADETVSHAVQIAAAAPDMSPPGRGIRTFEPAPPAPPIRPGGIRDLARRAAIIPHPRILAALKAAREPLTISTIADVADMRRDAVRHAVAEMAAAGLIALRGELAEVSPALTALHGRAAHMPEPSHEIG